MDDEQDNAANTNYTEQYESHSRTGEIMRVATEHVNLKYNIMRVHIAGWSLADNMREPKE